MDRQLYRFVLSNEHIGLYVVTLVLSPMEAIARFHSLSIWWREIGMYDIDGNILMERHKGMVISHI